MKYFSLLLIISAFNIYANSPEVALLENEKKIELAQECANNKHFLPSKFKVQCAKNYHHYQSSKKITSNFSKKNKKTLRISEFNALHPGMGKTRFKDYKIVATMLNQFDIIGVTELIPIMGDDAAHNENLIKFLNETPAEIAQTKQNIKALTREQRTYNSVVREREIFLLKSKLVQLQNDLKKAKDLYRSPGYLKILEELHRLKNGTEWSLILAPKGEAADTSPTPELVGYFYRSTVVTPKENDYCSTLEREHYIPSYGCIISMSKTDLGDEDKSHVFSRRPFMAEFQSGNFNFVLVTSHIIFDPPRDEDAMPIYMRAAFGVDSYKDFPRGSGITKATYARFVETKITLDFIKRYTEKNKEKDVIYMGDFNLTPDLKLIPTLLETWKNSEMYIESATSTHESRYHSDESETGGVSSSYDHFIFDKTKTVECLDKNQKLNGGVFNFHEGVIGKIIDKKYKVRQDVKFGHQYEIDQRLYSLSYDRSVAPYLTGANAEKTIGTVKHTYANKYSLNSKGIVLETEAAIEHGELFLERVMNSQLNDDSYYYFYEQLISDHLPIYMDCSIQ